MRCPKCKQTGFNPARPCPSCRFHGDPIQIEELAHLLWMLDELNRWGELGIQSEDAAKIQQKYESRQQALEIALGLRPAPLSKAEVSDSWLRLGRYELLQQKLAAWSAAGLLHRNIAESFTHQLQERMAELEARLEGHPRPDELAAADNRLKSIYYVLTVVNQIRRLKGFKGRAAETEIRESLAVEQESLEIELGLRPAVQPAEEPEIRPEPPAQPRTESQKPPPPPEPRKPLRERLWRSLLSERTLQAILFLGIFLLFTAAVSFVIWGWQDFSAPLRVAIPTLFTVLFFTLGWLVRKRTALYRSGIALSAIAALLIPIDLYTVYVNYGSPPTFWAEFWLATSLVCCLAYVLATLNIRSRFFGYLVGVAAGSAVLATIEVFHQHVGLSRDWYSAGLSLLALVLLLLGTWFARSPETSRGLLFAAPFSDLALLLPGVLMPLTLGWRFIDRQTYDALHTALTVNWWAGGLIFTWGALRHRSRSLGLLALLSFPVAVYLAQAGIFYYRGVNPAWQAFGLAWLVLLYFGIGHRLSVRQEDDLLQGFGQVAARCGLILLVVAALWSLTDLTSGAAAAGSHAVLAAAIILAAALWRRPAYLYGASSLAFTSATFAMTELGLSLGQSSVGWASLTLFHILAALRLGNRGKETGKPYARPLVVAGYAIAALALLPPLAPYDGGVLAYTLANWLGLAGWGAFLAHQGQAGFAPGRERWKAIFHWMAALPLPVWIWIHFENRRPLDFGFPLALAALSWGMFGLSLWLARRHPRYRRPWNLMALIVSVAAPLAAFLILPDGLTPAIGLLSAGLLYFADARTSPHSGELTPAGLVTAWGVFLLFKRLNFSPDALTFSLAVLLSVYLLVGLWVERKRSKVFTRGFLNPLYRVAHLLAFIALCRVYLRFLFDYSSGSKNDAILWWGAAAQIILALVYGLYAWGTYRERWGHLAAWLLTAGGGFIVIQLSTGSGRSAVFAALGAAALILAERGLDRLRKDSRLIRRRRALLYLIWNLYRSPLLTTGWIVSAGAIGMALVRNLVWLGGGRTRQIWSVCALLLITALYALSARLFRRARFVWLAGVLVIAPWTILTDLGWFTPYRLTEPGFAVSWAVLAWLIFLTALWVARWNEAYARPLKVIANLLLPFSLLWGLSDNLVSRYTFGLAIGLYSLGAWLDFRRVGQGIKAAVPGATKYLYLAFGLAPIWGAYWLGHILPGARVEHYALLLLFLGPGGLAAGRWLARRAPAGEITPSWFGLPAYLTAYACLLVGVFLTIHIPALFSLALLYDAAWMLFSARFFREPVWIYPAAALTPLSLLAALDVAGMPVNRRGWWLLGLAALYLVQTWLLRRVQLSRYSNPALVAGLALAALSLPPSSQDQIGALWGYAAAAILYAVCAFWLRKPLLLTLACALAVVPYAVGIDRLNILHRFYGLALFPGAIAALILGWALDRRFGAWKDFPWSHLMGWPQALAARLTGWWALPLYALGFGLAAASPFFTAGREELAALNLACMVPLLGWGLYRFRLRGWLAALTLVVHLAWGFYLESLGWWDYPAYGWLRFAPVTAAVTLAALWMQRRFEEGSPLQDGKLLAGWSRVLYAFTLADLLLSQASEAGNTDAAALLTLVNALLIAVLASAWESAYLPYVSTVLGAVSLYQWGQWRSLADQGWPVIFALLSLGYGLGGYGLAWIRRRAGADAPNPGVPGWLRVWESPLQISGMALSAAVLVVTLFLGFDLTSWTVRAMLGLPFRQIVEIKIVRMVVQVLSILGLLYLAPALLNRKRRLGYLAGGMLLSSWAAFAFYLQTWDGLARLQWYAIPAGIYLLTVATLEWRFGSRRAARWLDYAAMLLMLGSLFWQTLVFGWRFALLMGVEGLIAFWWGSARRLRRFFYAGIVGVMLATVGQLLNALQAVNQWITFGIIGILLVTVAVIVERKLEGFKAWQEVLEKWE